MRILKDRKFALDATGLVLAACLYVAAVNLQPPWSNVCLGVGTSFVFIAVSDVLVSAQRRLLDRKRVQFFGRELVRGQATFVYPDFEPHDDVTRVLARSKVQMRYQRPSSKIRPLLDFWIDAPVTAAANDLEAILYVAGIFGGLSTSSDALITDRRAVKACNRSFVSFGLGSNACTYLYFDHAGDSALFGLREEPAGLPARMYAQACDGREFHSSRNIQFGVIARYSPDRRNHPDRRWFFVAGLGPAATIGAGWYLAQNWRYLATNVPTNDDFAAFVTVPVIAPTTAHLDLANIVRKPMTAAQAEVAVTAAAAPVARQAGVRGGITGP